MSISWRNSENVILYLSLLEGLRYLRDLNSIARLKVSTFWPVLKICTYDLWCGWQGVLLKKKCWGLKKSVKLTVSHLLQIPKLLWTSNTASLTEESWENEDPLHFQPISQDFNSFLLQMPELHLNFTFWFVECGRCQRQKDILRFLDFCTHISVYDKQKQISYEHLTDGKGPTNSLKLVLLNLVSFR